MLCILMAVWCTSVSALCGDAKDGEEKDTRTEQEIMEGIEAHRESIVRVESICWDGEEEIYQVKSFSGFVISRDTMGIYVLTIHDGLTYTSEERETIKTEHKLEENARISEKIEVVFSGDVRVAAAIEGESEQRNLSLLKLGQNIHFEDVLQFDAEEASYKEDIYLLSYPEPEEPDGAVFNVENVRITKGTQLDYYQVDQIYFFRHNIQTDAASVGGPLLNADGTIKGVLLSSKGDADGTAISARSLRSFLDTFNIAYQVEEEIVEEKKLPVLNIILGFVIVVLLSLVLLRQRSNAAALREGMEQPEPKKPEPKKPKPEKPQKPKPQKNGEGAKKAKEQKKKEQVKKQKK